MDDERCQCMRVKKDEKVDSGTYLNNTSLPCIHSGLALEAKKVCSTLCKLGAEYFRVPVYELWRE